MITSTQISSSCLSGNKLDLKDLRAVPEDEARAYASAYLHSSFVGYSFITLLAENGLMFMETSALANESIEEAYQNFMKGM